MLCRNDREAFGALPRALALMGCLALAACVTDAKSSSPSSAALNAPAATPPASPAPAT